MKTINKYLCTLFLCLLCTSVTGCSIFRDIAKPIEVPTGEGDEKEERLSMVKLVMAAGLGYAILRHYQNAEDREE